MPFTMRAKPASHCRMSIEEGFFSAVDGVRLFYRFRPGPLKKNSLILLHGHGEHSGRYVKFFYHLEDLKIPIGAFDLRGSGQSGGEKASVRQFEDYLGDVTSFIHFLIARFEIETPIRVFGHSLGGLIALSWARENAKLVSKLILSSPLLGLPREKVVGTLAIQLNRFIPNFIVKNPVHPPFLTHDPEEVEKYRKDTLIQRKITIRLVTEMLRYASSFRAAQMTFSFPVYILMSEKDFIVDPRMTQDFFGRLVAPDKKLKIFLGFYHEIFNEVDQKSVFEELRTLLKD